MSDVFLIVVLLLSLVSVVIAGVTALMLRRLLSQGRADELAPLLDAVQRIAPSLREDALTQRGELAASLKEQRQELQQGLSDAKSQATRDFNGLSADLRDQIAKLTDGVNRQLEQAERRQGEAIEKMRSGVDKQLGDARAEQQREATAARGSLEASLRTLGEKIDNRLSQLGTGMSQASDTLRTAVEQKLKDIQSTADDRLEKMRQTVDEKLNSTLNQRLGESFKQVTEHLQAVHSGFGEMRHLAGSVTDLRRIMGNVKTRGTWGEAQLANVLEQIFAPSQYERNFRPRPQSREAVEFALRLPGADAQAGPVYLPIDSKFPVEDFDRIVRASESGDAEAARIAHADLINQVITCARSVRDKYIDVPTTTNFAVLFLPSEGLYAEVVREPGLVEKLLREYKVVIQGPTTFAAFSMALLMGFTTLAIQRRSADIQKLLGAIKSDFGKFGELLGKVEDRLDGAKQNIGLARDRSRQIVKKLDKVEQLPEDEAKLLLPDPDQDPDAIA